MREQPTRSRSLHARACCCNRTCSGTPAGIHDCCAVLCSSWHDLQALKLGLLRPGPLQAADGEPVAAAPAVSGASFAATDIGGGSAFARPSGAVEARTPRALEVEGSAYSAPVPSSALRSRSLVQAVWAYLPGSPTGLDRLPSGAFWLHVGDGSQPAGHASTGGEGSEGGERTPATPLLPWFAPRTA